MTEMRRRTFLTGIGALGLSGCTAPSVVTRRSDPFEGGIGGTGIVGTVGLGDRLSVNGLPVSFDRGARVTDAFGPLPRSALVPGTPVTVLGRHGRDGVRARTVRVDRPLIGPLIETRRGLSINGIPIRMEADGVVAAALGEQAVVAGLWTPTGVVATRIDRAPGRPDTVSGTVDVARDGGLSIGGLPISADASNSVSQGDYIVATGRIGGAGLIADTIRSGRFAATARLDALSVEGYLERTADAPGLRIAGLGHDFVGGLRLAPLVGVRAVFVGRYDGRFDAARGYVVPEGLGHRSDLLAGGLGDAFLGEAIEIPRR